MLAEQRAYTQIDAALLGAFANRRACNHPANRGRAQLLFAFLFVSSIFAAAGFRSLVEHHLGS